MNTAEKLSEYSLVIAVIVVAFSTLIMTTITGYGTSLYQLITLGAWRAIEVLISGDFADGHLGVVWTLALAFNCLLFLVVAGPIWAMLHRRAPQTTTFLIGSWLVFYMALIFVLFPATDGP